MDIKNYISSGIIEDYVFGAASPQEIQEVECMSHIYPEIKVELVLMQEAIERLAIKSTVNPPAELKARVMAAVKEIKQDQLSDSDKGKVIPLHPQKANRGLKFIAAASVIALIGIGAYSYFLKSDLNVVENKLAESEQVIENSEDYIAAIETDLKETSNRAALMEDQLVFIGDKSTKKIPLLGTEAHPNDLAAVFWNTETEKTLLDIRNLPELTAEESYQLWVLVDGVPQDMGVLEIDSNIASSTLIEMKSTALADAFAITVEPKGGSINPTLTNLRVIGTV